MSKTADLLAKNWIRDVRKALELTQAQLAEKIGVEGDRTIAKWEGGVRSEPGFTYVRRIAVLAPAQLQLRFLGRSEVSPAVSDPSAMDRAATNGAADKRGDYIVERTETRMVAEQLDKLGDDDLRAVAASAAVVAIQKAKKDFEEAKKREEQQNPSQPGAEHGPRRARRS